MIRRDYQQRGVRVVADVVSSSAPAPLLAAPTGSGKSLILADALEQIPGLLVTVPNQEIATGVLAKILGGGVTEESEATQRRLCEQHRLFTVKRALIAAERGELSWVTGVLHDEAHHGTDDTHDSLRDLLGRPPYAGVTATPYRGTPQETDKLRKCYPGGVITLLTLRDAVARGFIALPRFETLPLLDDETIDVANGEFVVKSVESHLKSRLEQLIEVLRGQYSGGRYLVPTTVVVGSVGATSLVAEAADRAGLPTVTVVAETRNRQRLFERVLQREAILIQVRAVGEGVDLPLRRMYDLSPTMSPVLWMQRVGRIMRPTADQPVYLSCCHNLMRHGYLFEGLIPRAAFAQARAAWGSDWKPSRRTMTRALGNTGFGRFAPVEVPLAGGGMLVMYALKAADGLTSYAAMLIPHAVRPIYFTREDALTGRTAKFTTSAGYEVEYPERQRGRWRVIPRLPELTGCASYPPDPVFPSMLAKWRGQARRYGLDEQADPSRKQYQALEILADTRLGIQ